MAISCIFSTPKSTPSPGLVPRSAFPHSQAPDRTRTFCWALKAHDLLANGADPQPFACHFTLPSRVSLETCPDACDVQMLYAGRDRMKTLDVGAECRFSDCVLDCKASWLNDWSPRVPTEDLDLL